MKKLLDHLAQVEGTHLHINVGESDITSPYGIYKKAHPHASIFSYIDEVAYSLGLSSPSSTWDGDILDKVDRKLDKQKVRELAGEFYEEFLGAIDMDMIPSSCHVAFFSMYTNSPKRAVMSLQSAINTFHKNHFIDYLVQPCDGFAGSKTYAGLEMVKEVCYGHEFAPYTFESYMLLEMSRLYGALTLEFSFKYHKFLNGWNNRLKVLSEER